MRNAAPANNDLAVVKGRWKAVAGVWSGCKLGANQINECTIEFKGASPRGDYKSDPRATLRLSDSVVGAEAPKADRVDVVYRTTWADWPVALSMLGERRFIDLQAPVDTRQYSGVPQTRFAGVYKLDGDNLRVAMMYRRLADTRAEQFESPAGSDILLLDFKRETAKSK